MGKVADTGDHKEDSMQECQSKALCNPCQHATRKRKKKADSSNSDSYTPRIRICGQARGYLAGSNSITQHGKLDSKAFELYFENIWSGTSEEKRNSFAYIDCLWFNLYTRSYYKEKVLNWVKRKDIFSKKYVLVPMVMWSHWSLLILCDFSESPDSKSRSPCMLLLDSLQSANHGLEPQIRKFVLDLHKTKERPADRESIQKLPFLVPKVPQQSNGEECGYYVLFYTKLFLENAPKTFKCFRGLPSLHERRLVQC